MQNRIISFISLFLIISTTLSAQFITTWKTDNPGSSNDNQITIPTTGVGYDYNINWGDGSPIDVSVTGTKTHTYAISGTYTVTITGIFPRIYFNGGGFFGDNTDFEKLLTIENWGTNAWTSMANAFSGCKNLRINTTVSPDLSGVTDLTYMFRECEVLNDNLSSWDVSTITIMNGIFRKASNFNQPLNSWNVSNVTDMSELFSEATAFNQPLNLWSTSAVLNMKEFFLFASSFNQDIGMWNVSNVTNMYLMFGGATVFNQDIQFIAGGANDGGDAWNTAMVTNMNQMLAGTEDFDQPIGNWNTANVTNIAAIFSSAHSFNQDVSGWDISGITDPSGLSGLFRDATSFNQDLSAWGVAIGGITNLSEMFKEATAFNQNLSGWNVISVTNMSGMFANTTYNQDISGWSVDNVNNFNGMFQNNTAFNQDISAANWDIASATDLRQMFDGATAFNQDLGGWDISSITSNRMINMLNNSGLSVDNYDNALIGWEASGAINITLGAVGLYYCASETARASLIVKGWAITDAGQGCISVFEGADTSGKQIINAQPEVIDFGSINILPGTKLLSFTIENKTGIDITNFSGSITGIAGFTLIPPAPLPVTINASSTLTINIELSDAGSGLFTETVSFTSANFAGSFDFTISGIVTAVPEPEIKVYEGNTTDGTELMDGVGFFYVGGAERGETAPTNQIIIENKGSANLNITGITLPVSVFSFTSPAFPIIIPINGTQIINLSVDTSTGGSFSEVLTIVSNDTSEPTFEITLNATIYGPEIIVIDGTDVFSDPQITNGQVAPINFGSAIEGNDIIKQFTFTNYGPVALNISDVNISGSSFSPSASTPIIINGVVDGIYSKVTFNIVLDGTTAGSYSETVTVTSDDDVNTSFTFNIVGDIIDPTTPKVYWTDGNEINRSNLNGSGFQKYHYEPAYTPAGIKIDTLNKLVYWTNNWGQIKKGSIGDTGLTGVVDFMNDGIDINRELGGLALDVTGQKIYWISTYDGTIKSANLTASNPASVPTTNIVTGLIKPTGIAIDPAGSFIYYTENIIDVLSGDNIASLHRVNIDGTNDIVLATETIAGQQYAYYDVVIDVASNFIYWTASNGNEFSPLGNLFQANLADVSGSKTSIPLASNLPYGIDLNPDQNKIYWTDFQGYMNFPPVTINSSNIDGTGKLILQSDSPNLSLPTFIALDISQPSCVSPPTISTGGGQTICEGSIASLLATAGGTSTTYSWATNGDGSFSAPNALATNYTPGPNDIIYGSVTINIFAADPDGTGPCTGTSNEMQLTINAVPTVNAGVDIINCTGLNVTLNGSIGGSATTSNWTTSGTGTLVSPTYIFTSYYPSLADIAAGSVVLTLTTNDPDGAGPCVTATDQLIMFFSSAIVNAGTDISSCGTGDVMLSGSFGGAASSILWSSPSGGTFSDATLTDAIYTPSAADLTIGSVMLMITTDDPDGTGPCPPATDQVLITFLALPTVSVGADQTICANSSTTVLATLTNATAGNWSSDGDGTFDNTNSLNAIYTPGITDSGSSINLTFTVPDPDGSGSCIETTDQLILTINSLDVINAGIDQTICETGTVSLSATINDATTPVFWASSGDGGFDDVTSLTPTYSLGTTDRINGSVILTISSGVPSSKGVCPTTSDALTVTLTSTHTADAGADQTICPSDVIALTGAIGGGASAGMWSSDGDGLFDDNTSLTTNYTPGSGDSSTGTVILTLTTVATNCSSVSDQVQLSISLPISAIDQSATLKTNETALIDVFNGGFINAGDVISTSIISNPTKGTVEINADGTINYTVSAGNVGSDSFGFEIKNQCNQTANATAFITIQNDAPNFEDGSATAVPGSPVTINIISLISDLNGNIDLSSIRIIQQPGSGAKATLDADNNLIVDYTGMVFFGTDEVIIEVCDFDGACTEASIFIEVKALPIKAFNAVSPNGDGKHDFLEFQYIEAYPNNEIKIFNRWGDVVFEAAGYNNNDVIFSGVSNKGGNNELPTGTYYYTVHLIDTDETVNGYFELRR